MISAKLGIRNLTRNRWRSALTMAAIAVAVGLMVWTLALYAGWLDEMVRGATAVQTAQVQIHSAEYVDNPRIYHSFSEDTGRLEAIRSVPGVVALSPRVEAAGIIGNEERSQVVQIMGVDPVLESETTPVVEAIVQGRWLGPPHPYPAPREVVLGQGVARQLQVGIGDELVVFLEASDGSLGNDLLEVVGIVRTANMAVDRMGVYIHLADAQVVTALEGQLHEIAIRTDDLDGARETAAIVAGTIDMSTLDVDGNETQLSVRSWQEILPSISQMILLFERSYWFMYLLIYLLAGIGILNTQRMSAMERRREFGVMMAIGMRPRRMFRTLQVETVVLGVAGAAVGALAGGLLAWYHTVIGLNMRLFADTATFSYMGVAFSERLHSVMTPGTVIEPMVVMIGFAMLCGLWPAFTVARLNLVATISGRT